MSRTNPSPRRRGSVASDDRRTPSWLVDLVRTEFDLVCDCAASEANTVTPGYWFGEGSHVALDALAIRWMDVLLIEHGEPGKALWLNPPFSGGQIKRWLPRIEEAARDGLTTVCLFPTDTSTDYFRWAQAFEMRGVGRLIFETPDGPHLSKAGKPTPAWVASMLVIVRPAHFRQEYIFL